MGVGLKFFENYSFGVGIALVTGASIILFQQEKIAWWHIFIFGSVFLAISSFLFGWTYRDQRNTKPLQKNNKPNISNIRRRTIINTLGAIGIIAALIGILLLLYKVITIL